MQKSWVRACVLWVCVGMVSTVYGETGENPTGEKVEEALTGSDEAGEVAKEAIKEAKAEVKEKGEAGLAKVKEEGELVAESEEGESEDEQPGYEYRRSYGFGLELGYTFNYLDRIGKYVSENNKGVGFGKSIGNWHVDLAFETSFLEGTRLTIFGGVESPFVSEPSLYAFYGGIEPAFAFRRNSWEVAVGLGVGFGGLMTQEKAAGGKFSSALFVLRPFFEARYYPSESWALFARLGFNQWLLRNLGGEVQPTEILSVKDGKPFKEDNLSEGGLYLAVGFRYGIYPKHLQDVIEARDKDGDGIFDRARSVAGVAEEIPLDQCPDEPEDFDGFQDEDGCPDLDNDGDGIPDTVDKCPNDPEDKDGFQDEDGCPDLDNDGDGIPDTVDKCPNDPEDKDGFEDEDGCPDLDNDGDGIPDTEDKCPLVKGVPEKQGCPFEKVQVTEDAIVILDKVFFAYNSDKIKTVSFGLLNDVASTIKAYPRIKKLEVGGHTDHAGSAKYNEKLSQRRADSVMKYLVEQGVEAERLSAKGYGENAPLVPLPENGKETKEGAEKNRRVEFKILEQEEVTKMVREDLVEKQGERVLAPTPVKAADGKPSDEKQSDKKSVEGKPVEEKAAKSADSTKVSVEKKGEGEKVPEQKEKK